MLPVYGAWKRSIVSQDEEESLLYGAIKTLVREQFNRMFEKRGMGRVTWMHPLEAEYSYQINDRRGLYRGLDCVLWSLGIRRLPRECGVGAYKQSVPALPQGVRAEEMATKKEQAAQEMKGSSENQGLQIALTELEIDSRAREIAWSTLVNELGSLMRHDDALNWQKFHYMLFVFGALLTAYVWSANQPDGAIALRIVIGAAGCFLAWGADLTFQEGLRCLRAHRRKFAALEEYSPKQDVTILISRDSYNQRDVLEAGPVIILACSAALIIVASVDGVLRLNV